MNKLVSELKIYLQIY